MEEHNYTVYMHICPNDKKYIGITSQNVKQRWAKGIGYKKCPKFYKAIQKYNWEYIQHIILFTNLNKEEAEQKEIDLIKKYNTTDDNFGYNLAFGGNTTKGYKYTKEQKEKLSKSQKGKHIGSKNGRYGKHCSDETKLKIKNALIKRYNENPELRKKVSEKMKGNKNCLGKHLSDETKNKISNSQLKSKKNQKYKKPVLCIDNNTKYNSIKEAGRILNINSRSIQRVCKGERKTAGKLHWKYVN